MDKFAGEFHRRQPHRRRRLHGLEQIAPSAIGSPQHFGHLKEVGRPQVIDLLRRHPRAKKGQEGQGTPLRREARSHELLDRTGRPATSMPGRGHHSPSTAAKDDRSPSSAAPSTPVKSLRLGLRARRRLPAREDPGTGEGTVDISIPAMMLTGAYLISASIQPGSSPASSAPTRRPRPSTSSQATHGSEAWWPWEAHYGGSARLAPWSLTRTAEKTGGQSVPLLAPLHLLVTGPRWKKGGRGLHAGRYFRLVS